MYKIRRVNKFEKFIIIQFFKFTLLIFAIIINIYTIYYDQGGFQERDNKSIGPLQDILNYTVIYLIQLSNLWAQVSYIFYIGMSIQ